MWTWTARSIAALLFGTALQLTPLCASELDDCDPEPALEEQRFAECVSDYNELLKDERFDEAIALGEAARLMQPENPLSEFMVLKAKFARQDALNRLFTRFKATLTADLDGPDDSIAIKAKRRVADSTIQRLLYEYEDETADDWRLLENSLERRIAAVDLSCILTDAQKRKLRIAGRGDIRRFFDRVEAVRPKLGKKLERMELCGNADRSWWEPIRPARSLSLFEQDSLFSRTLKTTLAQDSGVALVDDTSQIADVREFWNSAVRAARAQKFEDLAPLLSAAERRSWLDKHSPHGLDTGIAARFPREVDAGNSRVLLYRQPDGQTLARIYSEQRRDYFGRQGVRRKLLATIAGDVRGDKLIRLDSAKESRFGIGQSVAGIKLEARAANTKINSWKEFGIVLRFVNTSTAETIVIPSNPSFLIEDGLTIALLGTEPEGREKAFTKWYIFLMLNSCGSVSGLFESSQHDHTPGSLAPGTSHEFDLKDLGELADGFPDAGPTGTFRLFVIYDPNLEWDTFEAAVPAWRHRIASSEFTVTVER